MTQITDRTTIRAILETDRPWAAYALADLEPGFFEYSTWFSAVSAAPALALVYSAFRTPVLITLGKVQVLRAILHELETILNPPELYAVVRSEVVPLLAERYHLAHEKAMQRMVLAIAGTHVVTRREGVGCLGNIYTRRDRRGRGLSTRVTRAVTAQLLNMKLQTVALNVQENNAPAIRVYQKLGFQRYCGYVEAAARKRT
jgi:ribosomal protein S18 acetylase RimI-like enzyme